MSFGLHMRDRQEAIEEYGNVGNESLARLAEYMRRRAALSEEYARGLFKLHRQFEPAWPYEIG